MSTRYLIPLTLFLSLLLSACSLPSSSTVERSDIDETAHALQEEPQTTLGGKGDFQTSLFGMALLGDHLYYRDHYDPSHGIRRTPVEGQAVETVFVPSDHQQDMAKMLGWEDPDFYEPSDITAIHCLQAADGWIYWASDCAIWRIPAQTDGDISDLELIAAIGVPERPSATYFYVDGGHIYYSCNAIKERYDASTALVEHCLCKQDLTTGTREILAAAPSTVERLGYLYGNEYYKLVAIQTVCENGRVYYSTYDQEYIFYHKDGQTVQTTLPAYFPNPNSVSDTHSETLLFSTKSGIVASITTTTKEGWASEYHYHYYKGADLSDGVTMPEFDIITDDGFYSDRYDRSGAIPIYLGFYKTYPDGSSKRITADELCNVWLKTSVAGVCGDHFYYYTQDKKLCRMDVDGGNWEDVSWMINER